MEIVLPVSTGVVAAIFFIVFEIILLPILSEATSRIASVIIERRARKGHQVRIETIKFPFWSEGLLQGEWTHFLLLLVRIIFIAIPVYLETRLISFEEPVTEQRVVKNAYRIAPRSDWPTYQRELNRPAVFLRETATSVFDKCAKHDQDDWITAAAANFSISSTSSTGAIQCLPQTQKRVLRSRLELPPHVEERNGVAFVANRKVDVDLSWEFGRAKDFPPSDTLDISIPKDSRINKTDTYMYRFLSASVRNEKRMQCFTEDLFWRIGSISGANDGILATVICQNVTESFVDYYLIGRHAPKWMKNGTSPRTNGIQTGYGVIRNMTFIFVGRIEYATKPFLNAGHLINVDIATEMPVDRHGLTQLLRRLLYTEAPNVTLPFETGELRSKTKLDSVIVTTALIEFSTVILLGFVMLTLSYTSFRQIPMPNKLTGLSKSWKTVLQEAHDSEEQTFNVEKVVTLSYSKASRMGEATNCLTPVNTNL